MATETLELNVPAIHCEGCVTTIGMSLRLHKGVLKTQGDARTRRVRVTFDPAFIQEPAIREALTQVGYAPLPQTQHGAA